MSGYRRMRIGFGATLLQGEGADPRLDGIGNYARELATAFALRDDVTPIPVVVGARAARAARKGNADALVLPQGAFLGTAVSWATGADALGARGLAEHVDVFHATDYMIPRLRRTPVCATLFDAIPLSHPEWANPRLRALKNMGMRQSARWADRVIAISQAMVPELIEHYGIDGERIAVTPLGVDDRWFTVESAPRIAEVRARHGLAPGYLLFVGTLQPRKNVERIIAAYLRLPAHQQAERQLVIAGKAGWRADDLVATLREVSAGGRVRWLDYVEADDMRALYQGAAAFVFPSLYEGFGLPVLEAFASGVPVLTSTTTSLPEVAGDAALLVEPTDIDAIAAGMSSLIGDLPLAERLRAAGRARAREFTWARCAAETVAVLRSIL